jgi:transposase
MARYELTDYQWEQIHSLFPGPSPLGGRPAKAVREVVNGILWILNSGAPWRDLPERYGPWQTIFHRFNTWRKDGTLDQVLEALQIRLDQDGRIDWDLWCIDGSSVRASRAAAGAGKKGGPKNPKTTPWAARKAGSQASSTWSLTATAFPWRSRSPRVNATNPKVSQRF